MNNPDFNSPEFEGIKNEANDEIIYKITSRLYNGMKRLYEILGLSAVLGVGILIGWLCRGSRSPEREFVTHTDTLTIRDTIREIRPVYVEKTRTDTMLVAVTDTVTVSDTVYMVLDREQRHYQGEDYEAWVSGYRPALDSIYVFPKTRYITENIFAEPRKRWGIGIQAGYGIGISSGQVKAFPYIGVGISYDLIRW